MDTLEDADIILRINFYEDSPETAKEWLPLINDGLDYLVNEADKYYKNTFLHPGWLPESLLENAPPDYAEWLKENDKFAKIHDKQIILDEDYAAEEDLAP